MDAVMVCTCEYSVSKAAAAAATAAVPRLSTAGAARARPDRAARAKMAVFIVEEEEFVLRRGDGLLLFLGWAGMLVDGRVPRPWQDGTGDPSL